MGHKKRRNSIGTWTFLYEAQSSLWAVALQHLSAQPPPKSGPDGKATASLPRLRFERAAHARWSELEKLEIVKFEQLEVASTWYLGTDDPCNDKQYNVEICEVGRRPHCGKVYSR